MNTKIFLIIGLLFLSLEGIGQVNPTAAIKPANGENYILISRDTFGAARFIYDSVRFDISGDTLYFTDSVRVDLGGIGENVYSLDGTLTGDRTVIVNNSTFLKLEKTTATGGAKIPIAIFSNQSETGTESDETIIQLQAGTPATSTQRRYFDFRDKDNLNTGYFGMNGFNAFIMYNQNDLTHSIFANDSISGGNFMLNSIDDGGVWINQYNNGEKRGTGGVRIYDGIDGTSQFFYAKDGNIALGYGTGSSDRYTLSKGENYNFITGGSFGGEVTLFNHTPTANETGSPFIGYNNYQNVTTGGFNTTGQIGNANTLSINGTGTNTYMRGTSNNFTLSGGGTTSNLYGSEFNLTVNSGTTVSQAYVQRVFAPSGSGSIGYANAYRVADGWTDGFRTDINDGTGTHGFYATGTADNSFMGNVGIGNTTPFAKLDITGSGTTAATYSVRIRGSDFDEHFHIKDDGTINFGKFGGGLITGTAAKYLAVESGGDVIEVDVPTDENIYTHNGTLTANRTITSTGQSLEYSALDGNDINVSTFSDNGNTFAITDTGTGALSNLSQKPEYLKLTSAPMQLVNNDDYQLLWTDVETNSTTKNGGIGSFHYTNSEEPFLALVSQSGSSFNSIRFGGGDSGGNAATVIDFYTASNNTTTTGTRRMRINASGNLGLGLVDPTDKLEVDGVVKINDFIKMVPTATVPTSPASGWIYFDDGTNRTGAGPRYYNGSSWVDL